jgi:hypothetical protein
MGTNPVSVINVFFRFTAKLDAQEGRRAQGIQGNDYRDLEFLLNTYAMEIYNVRQWLWPRQKNVFFQDYSTVNAAFPDRVNNVKILLGIPDNAE